MGDPFSEGFVSQMGVTAFGDAMRFGDIIATEQLKKRQATATAKAANKAQNADKWLASAVLNDKLKKAKKAVAKMRQEIHDQLHEVELDRHRADLLDPSGYHRADQLIQEAITMLHRATQIRGHMNTYITTMSEEIETAAAAVQPVPLLPLPVRF